MKRSRESSDMKYQKLEESQKIEELSKDDLEKRFLNSCRFGFLNSVKRCLSLSNGECRSDRS